MGLEGKKLPKITKRGKCVGVFTPDELAKRNTIKQATLTDEKLLSVNKNEIFQATLGEEVIIIEKTEKRKCRSGKSGTNFYDHLFKEISRREYWNVLAKKQDTLF